jgi:hypothetical protein
VGENIALFNTLNFCLRQETPDLWNALFFEASTLAASLGAKWLVTGLDAKSALVPVAKKQALDSTKVVIYWDTRESAASLSLPQAKCQVECSFG